MDIKKISLSEVTFVDMLLQLKLLFIQLMQWNFTSLVRCIAIDFLYDNYICYWLGDYGYIKKFFK